MKHISYKLCLIVIFILIFSIGCSKNGKEVSWRADDSLPLDSLRVATMYGATSYFIHQGAALGFDYELAKDFASRMHLQLSVTLADSEQEMTELLREKKVDMIVYNTFETKKLKEEFDFVFAQKPSYLTLVQLMSNDAVANVTELKGKEVWVKENSIHHERLKKLNEEIGGGIIIKLANDSLSTDDLMDMVVNREIFFTLAYQHKARLEKRYNKRLDTRIAVGFNQNNGWLIRKEDTILKDSIKAWQNYKETKRTIELLSKTYWNDNPYFAYKNIETSEGYTIPKGAISPYDNLFKQNAERIGWDWRLVAAVAYAESGFSTSVTSWAGARGVMQLMPSTAEEFGVDRTEIDIPSHNIYAGTEYIKSLNMIYQRITNKEERIKFILASYNSGPAPVLDAMALAKVYGKNPNIWFDNVEFYLKKLSEPEYYNHPVVKYGRFGGAKETTEYVPYVLEIYNRYLKRENKRKGK